MAKEEALALRVGDRRPVWYVAYGSNLLRERFWCYLAGGCPQGARRTYPGCRDQSPPGADDAVLVPGRIRFAGESRVWGGGMAYYDPGVEGATVAARAYLLGVAQLTDIVCQETRRPLGTDLGLDDLLTDGPQSCRDHRLGDGGYDTVLRLAERDAVPMFTITSRRRLAPRPPSAAYLRVVAAGLRQAHGWSALRIADYLEAAGGVAGAWTHEQLLGLARPPLGVFPSSTRRGSVDA